MISIKHTSTPGFTMATVQLIAHRGASAEFPENSLPAFQRAIDLDCAFIELDLHLAKDGVPVCHHDADFVANPEKELRRRVVDHTAEELADLTRHSVSIPSLLEVLHLERSNTGLMLELKLDDNAPDELAHAVASLVQDCGHLSPGPILLGSLSPRLHRALVPLIPREYRIGIVEDESSLPAHLAEDPLYIALNQEMVTEDLVNTLLQTRHRVWSWTVDAPERAQELISCGVCGIITNDPAGLLDAGIGP